MSFLNPSDDAEPGVGAMSVYVPPFRVPLRSWCEWTGNRWDKVSAVAGHSFRMHGPHENVYTMAANAVLRLIRDNAIDPRRIGLLALGTESSTDNAAGAVIVRGMVDRALERLGLPRLPRRLEVPELKHACLGGIYALKYALRYVAWDGAGMQAIVVAADVAEYERGSSGEQTQGAGAVAMLVEREPRLFSVDLRRAGSASDYRGPDFRKPVARHFTEGYAAQTQRPSDFPVFSGRYSTYAYLDECAQAFDDMAERLGVPAHEVLRGVRALFFHRPYHLMPVQALSFLYARALARGEQMDELAALCADAGVAPADVLRENGARPDLYARVVDGDHAADPYPATSAAASVLRKRPSFEALLREKMSLGVEAAKDLGNLYSASLPAWIAAALEEAAGRRASLAGAPMAMVGYGSGDAAEAVPFRLRPGWQDAAQRIQFARALSTPIDLDREAYETLHDRRELRGIPYAPRGELAITRVGSRYDAAFQDLGVEYYEFMT